jgi:hypothetical protein
MRRREFITLLDSAAASLLARAQQGDRRLGVRIAAQELC